MRKHVPEFLERNGVKMSDKILKVMEEDWKYLIILDACRYDYFAKLYRDYFSGKLEKRISLGSCTPEWLRKNFTSYYPDVIYISGNPYINSRLEAGGFDAKRHFYKIVDVWNFGWDEKLGTVPPENINSSTLIAIKKFPTKRFIIHYLQPHAPYISEKFFVEGFPVPFTQGNILNGVQENDINKVVERVINLLGALLMKAKLIKHTWELREKLGLPPASPMDAVRRTYGVEGLRRAYKENLHIVLRHAAKLCKDIMTISNGKIVVTADHGELLGEYGRYSHGSGDQLLHEVPWFEVNGIAVEPDVIDKIGELTLPVRREREKVKDRIRKLKESGKL